MTSFFRFAIQTAEHRHSEVWSFFGNKKEGCIYATRASMKDWLKVSFHESGACHIKSYRHIDGKIIGTKDHAWREPPTAPGALTHLMRLIYDLQRQGARLPRSDRVRVEFEEWGGIGSVHLNVYAGLPDVPLDLPDTTTILADQVVGKTRRVVFALDIGESQPGLPEGVSGAVIHLGEDSEGRERTVLNNMTGIWYATPRDAGTLVMLEASAAKFSLESGTAIP